MKNSLVLLSLFTSSLAFSYQGDTSVCAFLLETKGMQNCPLQRDSNMESGYYQWKRNKIENDCQYKKRSIIAAHELGSKWLENYDGKALHTKDLEEFASLSEAACSSLESTHWYRMYECRPSSEIENKKKELKDMYDYICGK